MKHVISPRGVCPSQLEFELEGNIVKNISFRGGCNGNLKAISILADGMSTEEIKDRLLGIKCGFKSTSCADQLAQAVINAAEKEQA
ncbi:MAG: TIGR03905 family TSCPD domain-containing protein [Bacillota bacterium]|nr:TIGR03905 family TSCPD domain-containing protein [Bacillota bacterium]